LKPRADSARHFGNSRTPIAVTFPGEHNIRCPQSDRQLSGRARTTSSTAAGAATRLCNREGSNGGTSNHVCPRSIHEFGCYPTPGFNSRRFATVKSWRWATRPPVLGASAGTAGPNFALTGRNLSESIGQYDFGGVGPETATWSKVARPPDVDRQPPQQHLRQSNH